MSRFIVNRLVRTLVVIWGVSTIVFLLLRLSGDPVSLMVPFGTPPEEIAQLRTQMGFDRPLLIQYASFLGNVVRGDFGESITYNQPALQVVLNRLPATVELSLVAMALAVIVGLGAGLVSAVRRNSFIDRTLSGVAMLGQGTPSFVLGIFLILIFSVQLQLLPTGGRGDLSSFVMPSVTLAALLIPTIMRITRSEMIQTLQQDFIRTARAKGNSGSRVVWRHGLRVSSLPIVTVVGLQLGYLLGGAIIVETVFSWPGIGQLAVQSISARDYPVVQVIVFLAGLTFVLVNAVVDISYGVLDPRVRHRELA